MPGPRAAWALAFYAAAACGCGGPAENLTDETAERLRQVTLAYVQHAAQNRGIGPADAAQLRTALSAGQGLAADEVETCLISPRDGLPWAVRWGKRPLGDAPLGPAPPRPEIVAFERQGIDGVRYAGDGRVSVRPYDAASFAAAVPDAEQFVPSP